MTLEHPWWATRPRCEFCVHWTHDQDRRHPLLGTCDNKALLLSGEVVKFRIQNDWCCDLYRRRDDLPPQRRIA